MVMARLVRQMEQRPVSVDRSQVAICGNSQRIRRPWSFPRGIDTLREADYGLMMDQEETSATYQIERLSGRRNSRRYSGTMLPAVCSQRFTKPFFCRAIT